MEIVRKIKEEFFKLKGLDKKVITILVSVAVFQTFSWYFTSRKFFNLNLFQFFQDNPNINLIEYSFWFLGDSFSFFVLPLITLFILREKIKKYGLYLGDYKFGFKLFIILLPLILITVWLVSGTRSFYLTYPYLSDARENWEIFFIYESLLLVYIFSWEFIWRGYMLFGLEAKFGYYAIFIQMIPFVILHNGKPALETFSAIAGGIFLGMLAFKTRTFLYGVFLHFSLIFSLDLFSTLRYRNNEFGIGIDSLMKIFFIN